ncbi:MAG: lyase family protein [Pseudomonadota bacterium]
MRELSHWGDLFTTPEMREIWSEEATIAAWLRAESSLAEAQAKHGVIPPAAAAAIGRVRATDIDLNRLRGDMALVGRPIIGLVKQIREHVGADTAAHVHCHSTTQDIMDTASVLQMQAGINLIQGRLSTAITQVDRFIEENGQTEMMGRTNGQAAIPLQFATKLGVWRSELSRRSEVIRSAATRCLAVQMGGAVGDLSQYGNAVLGQAVKVSVAEALNLAAIEPHWQNARDGIHDIASTLGALCATLAKIAQNVNLLASNGIDEVSEGYVDGRGASSAMAHKQNQRGSEFGEAVARLGRQCCERMGEATLHQHERSGGAWIMEWVIIPEAFLFTDAALSHLVATLGGLQIHSDRMQANVRKFYSETT